MKREKLTLAWRGETTRLPDIIFDDDVEVSAPVPAPPASRVLALPPPPVVSVTQQHYDNVVRMLEGWAEWVRTGEPIAEGAPRQCLGAPDARIHSFEDLEIEVNKRLVREMHTAVWDLPIMEREAVMMHYGLNTRSVWRAAFDSIFDQAVRHLYEMLKSRVSC